MLVAAIASPSFKMFSLEDWMENPPEGTEWIDGELLEKTGMTLKHSKVQSTLSFQ